MGNSDGATSLCIGISPPPRISGGYEGRPKISRGVWRTSGGKGGRNVRRKSSGEPRCGTDTGGGFERLFLLPPAVPRRRPRRFTSRGKSLVTLGLTLRCRRLYGAGPPQAGGQARVWKGQKRGGFGRRAWAGGGVPMPSVHAPWRSGDPQRVWRRMSMHDWAAGH
jgi:hypothetical protein